MPFGGIFTLGPQIGFQIPNNHLAPGRWTWLGPLLPKTYPTFYPVSALDKYSLSTYEVPGTIPGTGDTAENQTQVFS